jgi:hypothetical protein
MKREKSSSFPSLHGKREILPRTRRVRKIMSHFFFLSHSSSLGQKSSPSPVIFVTPKGYEWDRPSRLFSKRDAHHHQTVEKKGVKELGKRKTHSFIPPEESLFFHISTPISFPPFHFLHLSFFLHCLSVEFVLTDKMWDMCVCARVSRPQLSSLPSVSFVDSIQLPHLSTRDKRDSGKTE